MRKDSLVPISSSTINMDAFSNIYRRQKGNFRFSPPHHLSSSLPTIARRKSSALSRGDQACRSREFFIRRLLDSIPDIVSAQRGGNISGSRLGEVGFDDSIGTGREDPNRVVPRAIKAGGVDVIPVAPGVRFEIRVVGAFPGKGKGGRVRLASLGEALLQMILESVAVAR